MYKLIFIFLFLTLSFVQAQTIINWNKNERLNYENFKKKPTQKKTPQGFLASKLGWQIAETKGKIPDLKVYNRFDENNSWISMKHKDILKDMQLQFDLSELYARKIRKEFEILQNKKITDKKSYSSKFALQTNNFQKRLKSIAGVTLNQPDLYNLLNKQVQDSLLIYKSYSE